MDDSVQHRNRDPTAESDRGTGVRQVKKNWPSYFDKRTTLSVEQLCVLKGKHYIAEDYTAVVVFGIVARTPTSRRRGEDEASASTCRADDPSKATTVTTTQLPKAAHASTVACNARKKRALEDTVDRRIPGVVSRTITTTPEDARIPHPSQYPANRPLAAYPFYVHSPATPPHPTISTWHEYRVWLSTSVEYRKGLWYDVHGNYLPASSAGAASGIGTYETPIVFASKMREGDAALKPDRMRAFFMESGYYVEPLHVDLITAVLGDKYVLERCDHSLVHPTETWIMATPDAYVVDVATKQRVGLAEFKSHFGADAKRQIPPEHMCQMQIAMQVSGYQMCLYSSLRVDEATGNSEWVLTRVERSDRYWEQLLQVLRCFVRAFFGCGVFPTRGSFAPPDVDTRMLVRLWGALEYVDCSATKLTAMMDTARRAAEQRYTEDCEKKARADERHIEEQRRLDRAQNDLLMS
jgi:hypothetical protein